MTGNSTARPSHGKATSKRKLKKPRKDFPLGIHQGTGYWCKKNDGHVYYFGKVADDPTGEVAVRKWLAKINGEECEKADELTLGDLCNEFLSAKEDDVATGELRRRSWRSYYDSCAVLIKELGRNRVVASLAPADLRGLRRKLSKGRGLVALGNELTKIRSVFLFALEERQIAIPYKKALRKPKPDAVRRAREEHRSEHGNRMLEAAEIRQILDIATQALKAMTLLGINCAFGQSDLSNLPTNAVNLETGMIDFARVKTAVPRRIPLWPETIAAIREWLAIRPKAKAATDNGLLFLTVRGARWVTVSENGTTKDAVIQEFNKLLTKLGLKRKRTSFYALRHSFQTVGSRTKDELAVSSIMGHTDYSMAARYREGGVDDGRLRKVVEYVHDWLFDDTDNDPTEPKRQTLAISDPIDPCDPKAKPVNDVGPSLKLPMY